MSKQPQKESLPEKKSLYTDLLAAQRAIQPAEKDAKNPYFKRDYTSLNATIAACKSALNDQNILVLQPIESDSGGVYVCTQLVHAITGETLKSRMVIREAKPNDPQAQGSAITYARRYSLKAMLCLEDEDDDGEAARVANNCNNSKVSNVDKASQQPVAEKMLMVAGIRYTWREGTYEGHSYQGWYPPKSMRASKTNPEGLPIYKTDKDIQTAIDGGIDMNTVQI